MRLAKGALPPRLPGSPPGYFSHKDILSNQVLSPGEVQDLINQNQSPKIVSKKTAQPQKGKPRRSKK
jgi:hypothetical protein